MKDPKTCPHTTLLNNQDDVWSCSDCGQTTRGIPPRTGVHDNTFFRIMKFGPNRFHVQMKNGEFAIHDGQFVKLHRTTPNLAVASTFGTVLCARMLLLIPSSVPVVDADGRVIDGEY